MFDLIYSDRKTDQLFVGKVDPRAKILLFICFTSVVIIIPTFNLIPLMVLIFSKPIDGRGLYGEALS